MEQIYEGHGIKIIRKCSNYFLIYDAGEICDRTEEIQITKEDAELAMKSSMDAYNVIIKYQNKAMFPPKI